MYFKPDDRKQDNKFNSTKIDDAFEGGHRLERRDENINIAFTYGIKLNNKDLDNPNYKNNILIEMRSLKSPCREHIRKKILRLKDTPIETTEQLKARLAETLAMSSKKHHCHGHSKKG